MKKKKIEKKIKKLIKEYKNEIVWDDKSGSLKNYNKDLWFPENKKVLFILRFINLS